MAGLEGQWEDDAGDVVTIKGSCLSVADGTTLELDLLEDGAISFGSEDQVFEGRLQEDGTLAWSDGAVWTRRQKQGFQGAAEGPSPFLPRTAAAEEAEASAEAEDAEEEAEAKAWEAELRRLDGEDAEREAEEELPSVLSSAPTAAPTSASASSTGRIEVVARHATEDFQVRVLLPKHAKFKHVKKALAARLGCGALSRKALLTYKLGGRYRACKDQSSIGDVRQVLVSCAEFGPQRAAGVDLEAALSEGEVSAEESLDILKDIDKEDDSDGAATSAPSKAPRPPIRMRGGKPVVPTLTLEQAISLQKELLAGYKEYRFQARLDSLDRIYGAMPDCLEFQQERQELFLTVQSVVLPRYGFQGNLDGVFSMMGAMGSFIQDPEFIRLAREVNKTLGIRSPPASWGKLSEDCKQLQVDASDPDGSKAAAARRRRPELKRLVPLPADGEGPKSLLLPLAPAQVPLPADGEGPKSLLLPLAPAQACKPAALSYEPYPAGRVKPYKLFVAGSWSNYSPEEMTWQRGLFLRPITLDGSGLASFQLLKNGKWNLTIYPSVPDASHLEAHDVCGPDGEGHDKNWTIGRFREEEAAPGKQFAIMAALDKQGSVRLVRWEHMA